jgi:hypothetical protein
VRAVKVFVAQKASLTDVHWTMSGEVARMTLVGGLGPGQRAIVIIAMQQYLVGFDQWGAVIQGTITPPRRHRYLAGAATPLLIIDSICVAITAGVSRSLLNQNRDQESAPIKVRRR